MTSRTTDVRWRCGSFAAAALVALGLTMGAARAADRWNDDAVMATWSTTGPQVRDVDGQSPQMRGKVAFEFCGG